MVGSAFMRRLETESCDVVTAQRSFDLRDPTWAHNVISRLRPDVVILAAAKVGGIAANAAQPADFLYDNLMIAASVINAAHEAKVEKLLYLGSSCIYPLWDGPIPPSALLQGRLEPTNEAYAIAKIAGVKLCQAYRRQHGCDFISVMPTNLYGPNDNYDLETSHVVAALIRKIHEAKERGDSTVTVWGTGAPLRELLHVDDLADACVHVLKHYSDAEPINIGSGYELSIHELAVTLASVIGFEGEVGYDTTRPDGIPRKLLDSSRLTGLGWQPSIHLVDGLRSAYRWYTDHREH